MDEQTRDEKNYLGGDLFQILGEIKQAIVKGEMEDPDAEENMPKAEEIKISSKKISVSTTPI